MGSGNKNPSGSISDEERLKRQKEKDPAKAKILKGKTPKMNCPECNRLLSVVNNFYAINQNSDAHKIYAVTGKIPVCKDCIRKATYKDGLPYPEGFKLACQWFDIPYIKSIALDYMRNDNWNIGIYKKDLILNSTYKDWFYEDGLKLEKELEQNNAEVKKEETMKKLVNREEVIAKCNDEILTEDVNKGLTNLSIQDLKDKFGDGYPDAEYYLFEKKYQQLRPSAKILTTFHDEFLKEYCVDKVKETLAKSKGNFKEAKEWASMAKDAASAGKLNPSQMSKADLTGGMDTFGQMVKMVEETPEGELQKILPKFTEKPKDKVDVVLWCYVNYARDLKGLPSCEYKEIYDFYEERKDSYEKQMLDNEDSDESQEEE